MKAAALFAILLLAACKPFLPKEMTRAEVIAACKECQEAGFSPQIYVRGAVDDAIIRVDCYPPKYFERTITAKRPDK